MHRKLSKKWKHAFFLSADESDTNSNPIETAFQSDDIIKQGYLRKESTHLKTIQKRWMVLKRDHLYSYKHKNKATETFDLSIYDSVQMLDYGEYRFELMSTTHKHRRTFIATSDNERKEWVHTIKDIQTNRLYKNWKYEKKSFKTKADKALKIGLSKTKIKTAFMNKTPEIHNPTDDPIDSDDSDYKEQCAIISAYKSEIVLDIKSKDIMNQLSKFGYSKSESIEAINNVSNKHEINSITAYIESERQKSLNTQLAHTQDVRNQEEWESILDTMCSTIPSEQQLLIFLKLKIFAERMLSSKANKKYQTLNLSDTKLQQTVLRFNGGLQFLYQLGFEQDAISEDMLVCNKLSAELIGACIKCLDAKMKLLSHNVNFNNYRRGTVSDNITAMSAAAPVVNKSKSVYSVTSDKKTEFNLTQSMPLKGPQRSSFSFEAQNENRTGAAKQFYNFLSENNLEKYFKQFEKNECCDIRDIEYLVDDNENFLQNKIGIKNLIHRRKLVAKCKKLKIEMDNFENSHLMPPLILKQLGKHGIVTMDILCNEIENKSDLKIKYGISDDKYCELVWNIVSLQSNRQHHYLEQEGIQNVQPNETNFIDR